MTDHKHRYVPIVAGYTAPGEKTLSWRACGICGAEDPKAKRPAEAYDSDPDQEDA
jgi:hypothetical protein